MYSALYSSPKMEKPIFFLLLILLLLVQLFWKRIQCNVISASKPVKGAAGRQEIPLWFVGSRSVVDCQHTAKLRKCRKCMGHSSKETSHWHGWIIQIGSIFFHFGQPYSCDEPLRFILDDSISKCIVNTRGVPNL